jgi:hypothetical protein
VVPALAVVLPQMWLRTFHVCGGHLPAQHALLRFEELVDDWVPPPEVAAVLAEADGQVGVGDDGTPFIRTAVGSTLPLAGWRPGRFLEVDVGERVTAGQVLSSGPMPVAELARLSGVEVALRYVADDMMSMIVEHDPAFPRALVESLVGGLSLHWRWSGRAAGSKA